MDTWDHDQLSGLQLLPLWWTAAAIARHPHTFSATLTIAQSMPPSPSYATLTDTLIPLRRRPLPPFVVDVTPVVFDPPPSVVSMPLALFGHPVAVFIELPSR